MAHLPGPSPVVREPAAPAGVAARLVDELLSALVQDLRVPLNALTGWTGLLGRGDLGPAEATRAIEVIERNAELLRHRLDSLLDASRVLSGQVVLTRAPIDLEDVVIAAVDLVRPAAEARGLTVVVRVGPERHTMAGDAPRLREAFTRLLDNAITFTPGGGRVSVSLDREADRLRVCIADTGVGIAPDLVAGLFDRFRGTSANGPTPAGPGLGLPLVRRLVELHGGDVRAVSAGDGKGAEFIVSLPAATANASDTLVAPPTNGVERLEGVAPQIRGLATLVIEDDDDSREMLSVLLENAGAVPVPAATVADALRLLGDLEIDIVLSDIGMPGRDGYDLVRALRAFPNPRVQQAPAVAVTAHASGVDRARIIGAGFDAHVSKPIEPAELLRTMAAVVARRRAMPGGRPAMEP